jgi:hypothetical protein
MKLLSAKNKKYGMIILAALGAMVIISSVVWSIKAGVKEPGKILEALWQDIKNLFTFTNAIALLIMVAGIAGVAMGNNTAVLAVALGVAITTGAGVVTPYNTTYLPEFFHYVAATQLTGVKITVQGEGVVFDSDANGLSHCGVSRILGQVTNGYTFRITNGLIKNKNIIWEFTNSAAQTPIIYLDNHETAPQGRPLYLELIRQQVLANSGQDFNGFATLSLPSIGASDQLTVTYKDGTVQVMTRADMLERLQWTQNIVNTPVYQIDNYAQTIANVNVLATAAQTAYVQRWRDA